MLIPYDPNPDYGQLVSGEGRAFHEAETRKRRKSLLSELRMVTGLPDVLKSCNQDVLYKFVAPEGEVLRYIPETGNYGGVIYNKGSPGAKAHAQFAKVKPDLLAAAKAIGSQVMLVSIAMQLNDIQRMVEGLSQEMHRDRIAEIEAGESQFRGAVRFTDETSRKHGIVNAVQTLHTGLKKTIAELRARIAEAPEPTNRIFDHLNPFSDRVKEADRIMGLANESFQATMRGLGVLSECYAALEEPDASRTVLTAFLDEVAACDIQKAAQKARLTEFSGPIAPQIPWQRFIDTVPVLRRTMAELPAASEWASARVEIEFMPHEILGATP